MSKIKIKIKKLNQLIVFLSLVVLRPSNDLPLVNELTVSVIIMHSVVMATQYKTFSHENSDRRRIFGFLLEKIK